MLIVYVSFGVHSLFCWTQKCVDCGGSLDPYVYYKQDLIPHMCAESVKMIVFVSFGAPCISYAVELGNVWEFP